MRRILPAVAAAACLLTGPATAATAASASPASATTPPAATAVPAANAATAVPTANTAITATAVPTANTAITATAVPAAAAVPAATDEPEPVAVPSDLTATEVSFRGDGGLTLHGTVLSPATGNVASTATGKAAGDAASTTTGEAARTATGEAASTTTGEAARTATGNAAGAKAGRPGIVLVHGSGTGSPRAKLMTEAVEFARRGLSVLVYDKRSEGYSLTRRSYSALAGDALGAVATLRSQPGVDPAKVGIWGFSEGGWVAPIAASRSADIAFVVLVGANSQSPLRQQTWAVAAGLRKAGVSGPLVDRAERNLYRVIADGGLFPEPYYDPEPTIAALGRPVLAIWGVHDLLTPPKESPPGFVSALEKSGNRHYTIRFFAGADHAAHLTPDGGVTRLPELVPGYADLVGSWIGEVTAGRPPVARTSGPAPVQDSPTVSTEPPAWWESAPTQVAALVLLVVGFAAYPVVALARRLRGRSLAPVTRAARLVSAGGLAAVLGGFCYLFYLMMTGGKLASPGPVLAGRPLIWLVLQALSVACVVAAALTVRAWRRARGSVSRGERVRLGLLLTGGLAFVPWALYWGLLLP